MSNAAKKIDESLVVVEERPVEDMSADKKHVGEGVEESKDTIIGNFLRILTWKELGEIASVFDASSMIPLTQCLIKDLLLEKNIPEDQVKDVENKACIISFEKNITKIEMEEDEDYDFDKYDSELENLEDKNIVQVSKNGGFAIYDHEEEIKKKMQKLKKVNVGEFILKQKKKFEDSHKKLKKKEIYSSYKNNSEVDINQSKKKDKSKKGISVFTNTGQLINKRQK